MFHQWSNSLLLARLLFRFPVLNGQHDLRRVGHPETWNLASVAGAGTCKECLTHTAYINSSGKSDCQFTWIDIVRKEKVLKVLFSRITKGIGKGLSESVSHSVMSDSVWPHGLWPTKPSVHWFLQARILEWVAIPFSRGFSRSRDQTLVSCIVGRFLTVWTTREAFKGLKHLLINWSQLRLTYFIASPLLGTRGQSRAHSRIEMDNFTYTYINTHLSIDPV